MSDRTKFLIVALLFMLAGAIGAAVMLTSYHLYLDHLAVDQWRQEIVTQQLKILQQPPPPPK